MQDEELTPEERTRRACITAVRLLGSRDHSVAELTRKLRQREHDDDTIAAALVELQSLDYVDDERYAYTYAEQLMNRRRGPLAIRAKLRERGIDATLADEAIRALEVDWVEQASDALQARFDRSAIGDDEPRVRAKIARFLQGRGFSSSDSLRAIGMIRRNIESDIVS